MDSRYPPPEAHNVVNGLRNGLYIYGCIVAAGIAIYAIWRIL